MSRQRDVIFLALNKLFTPGNGNDWDIFHRPIIFGKDSACRDDVAFYYLVVKILFVVYVFFNVYQIIVNVYFADLL